ncbi:MAG: phosphoheptose isomerase [Chlamydiae bacterium SM23_39]|nr:MAG: phosphoheptose isomerase [Chlamydiae bacterium SM23_39]
MEEKICKAVNDGVKGISLLKEKKSIAFITNASRMIAECFKKEKKILIAGNGGSLCDGMHFSEELTGFFRKKRRALPSVVLSDPGHITCVSNDVGYEYVFSRGIEALGKEGDIFIALTTSGKSKNLNIAVDKAKEIKLKTISFLGKDGGELKGRCDLEFLIEGFTTSDRIQEVHMTAIHIIIEMVEYILFKEEGKEILKTISKEKVY